jgi:TatD DNase family protein
MDFVDVHTHKNIDQEDILMVRNLFPEDQINLTRNKYYSIGLHPWYIEEENYNLHLSQIAELAYQKEILAIGETGLDKITDTPFELQMKIFEKHIEISESLKKPLIIHCVRAFDELIDQKKKIKPQQPWIFHGFNSRWQVAEMMLNQGIYLSFGKALLIPGSNAAKVLSEIPEKRFFLETDDSKNSIREIYQKASEIRKTEIETLKSIILRNFKKCFGIDYG